MAGFYTFVTLALAYLTAPSSQAALRSRQDIGAVVQTVFQFDTNGTWAENLALRPDGTILTTRIDLPELWNIDPTAGTGVLVHSFPVTSLSGITQVRDDVFAINGRVTGSTDGNIFIADFSGAEPVFSTAATIPNTVALNGLTTFNESVVIASDSGAGHVLSVNIDTGASALVAEGGILATAPVGGGMALGVNGVRKLGNNIFFTNTNQQLFGRLPLTADATAAGPPVLVANLGTGVDDFAIGIDGIAYAATNSNSSVIRITPGGLVTHVAGNNMSLELAGDTSLVFANPEQTVLFVSTGGGQASPINGTTIEPAKIAKLTLLTGV